MIDSAFRIVNEQFSRYKIGMLKSRNNHPPGGFIYRQNETGWESSKWRSFDHVVNEIIAHRVANPRFNLPTDKETVSVELENFMTERLRSIPGGTDYLTADPGGATLNPLIPRRTVASLVGGIANAVAEGIKSAPKIVAGIGLWLEWFSSDGPVTKEVAEQRASTCVACPKNVPATGVNTLSSVAARELQEILGSLHEQDLHTSLDSKLNLCSACLCPLASKVWVPNELIKRNTSKKVKAALWEKCWILPLLTKSKPLR